MKGCFDPLDLNIQLYDLTITQCNNAYRTKKSKDFWSVEVINQINHTVRLSISRFQMTTPLLSPLDIFKKALNPIVSNIHILWPNVGSAIWGLNSTYVRIGSLGSFKKIGYPCLYCDIHYDKKLYTNSHKTEILKRNSDWASFSKQRMLRPGFEPGIVALRGRNA